MTPLRALAELEALAARVGIAIRAEPFGAGLLGGRGGLCRVRGVPVIVMDASAPVADKVAVLTAALARFDLDAVFVPPLLRARIESKRTGPPRPVTPAAPRQPLRLPLKGLARTRLPKG